LVSPLLAHSMFLFFFFFVLFLFRGRGAPQVPKCLAFVFSSFIYLFSLLVMIVSMPL
jgi:hypothetical protein